VSRAIDVAIIGGGIVGAATAAFVAGEGASVVLYEREELAAGASGRNSGSVQYPFDPVLSELHLETVRLYRELSQEPVGFRLSHRPTGLLLVDRDESAVRRLADGLRLEVPQLRPSFISAADLRVAEPALASGVCACRLDTGYPLRPGSATRAFANIARQLGASIHEAAPARLTWRDGKPGVEGPGPPVDPGAIVVAAGPRTPEVVDPSGKWRPIKSNWGVTVEVSLAQPPGAVLEEVGVQSVDEHGLPSIFSLVTAEGASIVGSTFLAERPDAHAHAPVLLERAAAYVPAIARAPVREVRSCARPQSADGRPLVGAIPGIRGLFVAAGHGPWGISTGPATARMIAALALGHEVAIPRELDPARFGAPEVGADQT
jgi:glycine/D-amino acid oxidase-like deaminating enzyme